MRFITIFMGNRNDYIPLSPIESIESTQNSVRINMRLKFNEKKFRDLYAINRRFKADLQIEKQKFVHLQQTAIIFIRYKAAVTLQALWRGYNTRKMIHNSNKQIESVCKKIIESASNACEDMRLGNRTECALQKLLTYKYLLPLSNELESLYKTTQLSPDSCVTIASNGAVQVLVQILSESNRSEPHKKIIYFVIGILLNLAKYSQTLPTLMQNSAIIDLIFKLISGKSFNRQHDVLRKSLSLAWILLRDPNYFKYVMSNRHYIDSIRKLNRSSVCQQKKANEVRITKQKIDNLIFSPNWHIANSCVYEFNDISYALNCFALIMNVK